MTSAIVGFEIQVERIEAKFKLGQNRSREDIQGLIEGMVDEGGPSGRALAELTRSTEQVGFLKAVDAGLADSEAGRVHSQAHVVAHMKRRAARRKAP